MIDFSDFGCERVFTAGQRPGRRPLQGLAVVQSHHAHDHFCGLSGTDLVEQTDGSAPVAHDRESVAVGFDVPRRAGCVGDDRVGAVGDFANELWVRRHRSTRRQVR